MIPSDIGAHPDAPHHYTPMRKPESWADEDCGTLTVRRVGATGDMLHEPAARIVRDDLPSGESVYPSFLMQWVPTDDERAEMLRKLMMGEEIEFRLLLAGNGLPPHALWLRGMGEV